MKSLTAVCPTGATAASMPALSANSGRIARHPPHRGDGENAEMKMYLSKLKDLVPFMPKNRKLSKLEIIQHVIDYICDLQTELETHPEINNFDAAAALSGVAAVAAAGSANSDTDDNDNTDDDNEDDDMDTDAADALVTRLAAEQQLHHRHLLHHQQQQQQQHNYIGKSSSPAARLPLVDRQAPNTILPSPAPGVAAITAVAAIAAAAAPASVTTTTNSSSSQTSTSLATEKESNSSSRQS